MSRLIDGHVAQQVTTTPGVTQEAAYATVSAVTWGTRHGPVQMRSVDTYGSVAVRGA